MGHFANYPVISADSHITEHPQRLLWANDFPHSDSMWPWSREMLAEQTRRLNAEQTQAILCGNVSELYQIDLSTLKVAA